VSGQSGPWEAMIPGVQVTGIAPGQAGQAGPSGLGSASGRRIFVIQLTFRP
jgi:hypothetical protein